jgi:glycosyltransferase involved in cell wall biosynthesis
MLKIIREIPRSDVCYVWFGTMTAAVVVFFTKLFRKKSIVVAGGLDVANEPDINYGLMNRPLYRFFPKFTFRHADLVIAVSKHTEKELLTYAKPKNHRVIYNGVEINRYVPKGQKKNIVITVGEVSNHTVNKKGIKTFVETSALLPKIPFYLIGKIEDGMLDYLKPLAGSNLEFMGFTVDEELLRLYQEAKVYIQVSKHESFGCSLAEAMLCECIPVVTKCGAIPEVVGDTGIYVPYDDPKETAKAIQKAFKMERSQYARSKILHDFPLEKREIQIIQAFSQILEGKL